MIDLKMVAYADLVAKRKACCACTGLENPAVYLGGKLDSPEIGPWTRWQGNLHASIMVIGQDWGDVDYFADNSGLDSERSRTNVKLCELLESVDIHVTPTQLLGNGGVAFFTNAILCLKSGGMQAHVDNDWFDNCALRFLRPQIELVCPRVVVSLGERAYRAVIRAFSLQPSRFRDAVESVAPIRLPNGSRLVPVYHCGARILNTHRSSENQLRDWQRVKEALRET